MFGNYWYFFILLSEAFKPHWGSTRHPHFQVTLPPRVQMKIPFQPADAGVGVFRLLSFPFCSPAGCQVWSDRAGTNIPFCSLNRRPRHTGCTLLGLDSCAGVFTREGQMEEGRYQMEVPVDGRRNNQVSRGDLLFLAVYSYPLISRVSKQIFNSNNLSFWGVFLKHWGFRSSPLWTYWELCSAYSRFA